MAEETAFVWVEPLFPWLNKQHLGHAISIFFQREQQVKSRWFQCILVSSIFHIAMFWVSQLKRYSASILNFQSWVFTAQHLCGVSREILVSVLVLTFVPNRPYGSLVCKYLNSFRNDKDLCCLTLSLWDLRMLEASTALSTHLLPINENVASDIIENVEESYTYHYNSTVHKHFVRFVC